MRIQVPEGEGKYKPRKDQPGPAAQTLANAAWGLQGPSEQGTGAINPMHGMYFTHYQVSLTINGMRSSRHAAGMSS